MDRIRTPQKKTDQWFYAHISKREAASEKKRGEQSSNPSNVKSFLGLRPSSTGDFTVLMRPGWE